MSDLEVLKEIPGYKAILKSVLKSQIQLLMEQLSEHAGEESIVLTASINDGSLSHLGSSTGKGFFEGRDEIKSQFLGYCLKTYHKQKTREPPKPYQRKQPSPRLSPTTQPAKRPRIYPVSLSTSSSSETFPSSSVETNQLPEGSMSVDSADSNLDISVGPSGDSSNVKTEFDQIACSSNNGSTAGTPASENLPSSIHLVHTQVTSGTNEAVDNDNSKVGNSDETQVKIEQVEDELEITGVEMAGNIDTWNQSHPGYNDDNGSYNMPSDQPGYNNDEVIEMMYGTSDNGIKGVYNHFMGNPLSKPFISPDIEQIDPRKYTADELLEKKSVRGKPSSAQLHFHTLIRDVATYTSIWKDAPSLAEIPYVQKIQYLEAIEQTLPQLCGRRKELWRRLGECLQNRRRYLKNKTGKTESNN